MGGGSPSLAGTFAYVATGSNANAVELSSNGITVSTEYQQFTLTFPTAGVYLISPIMLADTHNIEMEKSAANWCVLLGPVRVKASSGESITLRFNGNYNALLSAERIA